MFLDIIKKVNPVLIFTNPSQEKKTILTSTKDKSGVYLWYNIKNHKFYVGSSVKLSDRLSVYYNLNYLKSKTFKSIINSALLKYSKTDFHLFIIEFTDTTLCYIREQFWLDTLSPPYNINKYATSNLGLHFDLEKRKLLRDSKLNKKRSPECIQNMRISASRGKVYLYTIDKSLLFTFDSAKSLERIFGTKYFYIDKVINTNLSFHGYWLLSSHLLNSLDTPSINSQDSLDFLRLTEEVKRCKRVVNLIFVYDKYFNLLHRFEYLNEARVTLNIHDSTIRKYVNTNNLFKNKFYFSYFPLCKP